MGSRMVYKCQRFVIVDADVRVYFPIRREWITFKTWQGARATTVFPSSNRLQTTNDTLMWRWLTQNRNNSKLCYLTFKAPYGFYTESSEEYRYLIQYFDYDYFPKILGVRLMLLSVSKASKLTLNDVVNICNKPIKYWKFVALLAQFTMNSFTVGKSV